MIFREIHFFWLVFFVVFQSLHAKSLIEQFEQEGFTEICDIHHGKAIYDTLYKDFDIFIEFLKINPTWSQKFFCAKERFIRSKNRNDYSTDFFGLYNESEKKDRHQASFYYSTHFHEFICVNYPEFKQIQEIMQFLETCFAIQKPYENIMMEKIAELNVETIFSSNDGRLPILFKVMKYFPSYRTLKPHYDGSVLSFFLDSTDNQSLLLSPYKSSFTIHDFFSPSRKFSREENQNSILLIPGTNLSEFSIFPTPHVVIQSGKIRYATIAFVMRPNYTPQKNVLSPLPNFTD